MDLQLKAAENDRTVIISSRTAEGIEDSVRTIESVLRDLLVHYEAVIPYKKGEVVSMLHEKGVVDLEEHQGAGTYLLGSAPRWLVMQIEEHCIGNGLEAAGMKRSEEEEEIEMWKALAKKRVEYEPKELTNPSA
mmetsp:Transcript_19133/g.50763  ORF Transcript_19133/g.50763 Transcript_19133/m.50763 type:complete len:134 (-) Transcript_19133:243-644(-)